MPCHVAAHRAEADVADGGRLDGRQVEEGGGDDHRGGGGTAAVAVTARAVSVAAFGSKLGLELAEAVVVEVAVETTTMALKMTARKAM